MSQHSYPLDRETVMAYLPHRDPMLFIDQVISSDGTSIHARTIVDAAWPVFQGHFPDLPIMPGVLLIEATAQAGALIVSLDGGLQDDSFIAFSGVEQAKFRKPVLPGDVLDIHAEILRHRAGYYKFQGHIEVAGKTVVELRFAATQMPM
jgi:3-hydroxyacyl-[acyl-carrier-protein] dehydratase